MTERPILFSAPMVRAILAGQKTQTRRVCKPAEENALGHVVGTQDPADVGQRPLEILGSGWFGDEEGDVQFFCPYGKPGDRLYVRETWQHSNFPAGPYDADCEVFFRADYMDDPHGPDGERSPEGKYRFWKPSIHMPRSASRILLEVVSVRVERLNDCSEADALAEGVDADELAERQDRYDVVCKGSGASGRATAQLMYSELWESINGAGSWAVNPWVWVIEFKRVPA